MALLGLLSRAKTEESEMSFWSHFDALRGHLFRSSLVVLVLSVILFCYPEYLFDTIIFGPIKSDFVSYRIFCNLGHKLNLGNNLCFGNYTFKLQSLGLSDQFTSQMWIALVGGIILGAPYVLWEIWRFIRPALKDSERKASVTFISSATFLFISGVLFSYFLIVPLMINFLGNYRVSTAIENNFTMDSYISTVTTITLAAGLMFELPVLVYFLTRYGLVSPELMRKYRKHAIVIILIVAGIVTPSPDLTSQILVALPIYFLYETSIFVSRHVVRKKARV